MVDRPIVAGWAELNAADWSAIPIRLHEDNARECTYDGVCDDIPGLLEPDPADHYPDPPKHSGASIAVIYTAYDQVGGVPLVDPGEDRAFLASLTRMDALIRHAPEVRVTGSGRTDGRALVGMVGTIRRR